MLEFAPGFIVLRVGLDRVGVKRSPALPSLVPASHLAFPLRKQSDVENELSSSPLHLCCSAPSVK